MRWKPNGCRKSRFASSNSKLYGATSFGSSLGGHAFEAKGGGLQGGGQSSTLQKTTSNRDHVHGGTGGMNYSMDKSSLGMGTGTPRAGGGVVRGNDILQATPPMTKRGSCSDPQEQQHHQQLQMLSQGTFWKQQGHQQSQPDSSLQEHQNHNLQQPFMIQQAKRKLESSGGDNPSMYNRMDCGSLKIVEPMSTGGMFEGTKGKGGECERVPRYIFVSRHSSNVSIPFCEGLCA